ncbi:MAG TPA: hypothetical protein VF791_04025 [Pyrinomonadaceae bacterium]
MPPHEYPITLSRPELLEPEIVEMVFAVAQEQSIVCLSDIKRETGLKYDVIRAALHFLEARNLITVMKEEAKRLGIQEQQTPVQVTHDARRISLEEVNRMVSERFEQEEKLLETNCGELAQILT